MAIVQISRITNRKGATDNLPQLAGAELGWCIDSRRLFIGNGTLQEGAPIIGNTEILTEFSDITVLSNYTYQDVAVGYIAETGPSPSDPTIRTVQAKLDDMASVRDFGAVGDGVADDTAAINRALYQLYCRESNPQIRRSLFFPAGVYLVTESIVIPTYAKLIGEGDDCSIILLDTTDSTEPEYVAQYGDSQLQTGVNIGTNGATPPRNIEISSMSFQSNNTTNIFLVNSATQCWFDSVNFVGPITQTQIEDSGATPLPEITAVSFASNGSNITNDITFDKCGFSNITYAISTGNVIRAITVSNSKFNILFQGVVLTDGGAGGATGFRTVHNMFDNIYAEGIVYDDVSLNASAYNVFYNVGNSIGGASPTSPVITFTNDISVSINDLFERSDADAFTYPRIYISNTSSSTGGTQLTLGRYTQENGKTFTLQNGVTGQTIFTVNLTYTKAFQMEYTITRDTDVRHGVFVVVPSTSGTDPAYTDDFTEFGDVGIELSAIQSGTQVSVEYDSTISLPGTLTYTLSYLA